MRFIVLSLLAAVLAAPSVKRQINGILQGLAGVAGVDATFGMHSLQSQYHLLTIT